MNLNKINLLSFLMFAACALFTQSASAYWIDVNNVTRGQLRLKMEYPGWPIDEIVIEPSRGHRINTNNRCARSIEISDPADATSAPVVFKAPDTGGGVACKHFAITVQKQGGKIVVS